MINQIDEVVFFGLIFGYENLKKNGKKMLEVAGAERLELSTVGFGDRCSTIRTMPLWNCRSIINKLTLFVKGHIKINLIFF